MSPEERWPNVIASLLRARGHDCPAPEIIARTAWTTDELQDAMTEAGPRGPYDVVSLMIGVNDQYRARPVEQFEASLRQLLEQAIRLAGGDPAKVILVSIPDWGATPFAEGRDRALISREIDLFNARARAIATSAGARFHDVTASSRGVAGNPALVVADGLHPAGAMYREWAESLVPVFESVVAG